jgi:hypothetical protein
LIKGPPSRPQYHRAPLPVSLTERVCNAGRALVLDVLREPMLLLLLADGAIYFALGKLGEALLLALASVSILVTLVQEGRTERLLESLRDLTPCGR